MAAEVARRRGGNGCKDADAVAEAVARRRTARRMKVEALACVGRSGAERGDGDAGAEAVRRWAVMVADHGCMAAMRATTWARRRAWRLVRCSRKNSAWTFTFGCAPTTYWLELEYILTVSLNVPQEAQDELHMRNDKCRSHFLSSQQGTGRDVIGAGLSCRPSRRPERPGYFHLVFLPLLTARLRALPISRLQLPK